MKNANVALLQLCSGEKIHDNLAQIEQQIKRLPKTVQLVVTPENSVLFADAHTYRQYAEKENHGPLQDEIRQLARRYGVWLLLGSMPMISRESPELLTSSSLLFAATGELKARYDKLHLFDVDINDHHRHYRESDIYQHGQSVVVVETPVGKLGMTICYDLRFPGLFQMLRAAGAEIIAVPAAFTHLTGRAHWEVLLRARAIETQCFILAAAQVGKHPHDRHTWGHSLVVDPWGVVLAQNPDSVCALDVHIDCRELRAIREQMPIIQHDRFQPRLVEASTKK